MMRPTIAFTILLATFLLGACSGSSSDAATSSGDGSGSAASRLVGGRGHPRKAPPPHPTPVPTASLTVSDPSGAAGPFAIASLQRLVITIDAARFEPGQHAVRVDVTAPAGTLYAQLPAALTIGKSRNGKATTALQVRGSLIESFHDTGSWEFVASIDGVPMASASVDLQ